MVLAKALGLSFYTYSDESKHVDRAKLGHIGDGDIVEGCNVSDALLWLARHGGADANDGARASPRDGAV